MSSDPLRVDFYVLEQASPQARLRFACRLAEKAMKRQHRVHAVTTDAQTAAELDELLWTFRAESFVPHSIQAPDEAGEIPVTIGCDAAAAPGHGEVLINLMPTVPACFEGFERVAEIIDASDEGRRAGRERFRFYRDNGFEPQTHRIA
ncbi:MAG: DNA polymerase III subunit chi [Chromatiales bacterium]|nr:MAG: DNA polymerase III subunit chi [Chromatiales bacterium]